MTGTPVRQLFIESEARTRLRKGYTSPERIEELREFIGKRRGVAAVEQLVDEMRRQWGRRQEWIGQEPTG